MFTPSASSSQRWELATNRATTPAATARPTATTAHGRAGRRPAAPAGGASGATPVSRPASGVTGSVGLVTGALPRRPPAPSPLAASASPCRPGRAWRHRRQFRRLAVGSAAALGGFSLHPAERRATSSSRATGEAPGAVEGDRGGADQWGVGAEPGRPDAGAPGEVEPGPGVDLGLGGGEERVAESERHGAGHDGQAEVE